FDDDTGGEVGGLPKVAVTATEMYAMERGEVPGQFTFQRTGGTTSELTVYYHLDDSTAGPEDYHENLSGSVTIPAGQKSTVLTITPIDDEIVEGEESVVVNLVPTSSYTVDYPSSAEVRIIDNSHVPTAYADEATCNENASV